MHRTEPTSLQNMALQLAEKLGSLVENNERVFDVKQGVYGGYFNRGASRQQTLNCKPSIFTHCIGIYLSLFLFLELIMYYFSITDQKGGYQQKQSYQRGTMSFSFFQHMVLSVSPKTDSLLRCSSKLGLLNHQLTGNVFKC